MPIRRIPKEIREEVLSKARAGKKVAALADRYGISSNMTGMAALRHFSRLSRYGVAVKSGSKSSAHLLISLRCCGLLPIDYPDVDTIAFVVDNLNTHHPAALYERFLLAEACRIAQKFEWHFIPEHDSWLNIAECELAVLTRQGLKRRLPDISTLSDEISAWAHQRNTVKVTVD